MIRLAQVTGALPDGFEAMRAEARAEGHRMLDTLATEWASGAARFDRDGEALLAAYDDAELAGIGGRTREPALADALRMRRFYVRIAHRRGGIGRALADALLADPRTTRTRVTANAAAGSEAFWEALGFAPDRRGGWSHILIP